ncbi:Gfo/Idh/MocA family protein [Microbacterium sp. MPKO10]|uniref:Gfo/Idh/MocA family protein n=1 Tax=Microbacterium sp. MPKO10 TaxID=2989818 RepID=UPI00223640C8|nr:Gfo/Idh/MocA family oxidoreductase [Microbacterium sp. MPKO10]MCW4457100.1 Gfo/Idh/MocA family oxidoreductase [Microbacterium sp. MPKO10]
MSAFRTVTDAGVLRLVQVGAGGMGRQWIRTIAANPDVELVGLVDLNTDAATAALAEAGLSGIIVGTSVAEVAAKADAHAVVNVTVPAAHHPVNVEALFAGLPVLCEKPAAPTVAQALSLAGAASESGELLMISQSRRYYPELAELRAYAGELGEIGVVTTEFFKAPHFGGFREEMDHVLLIDMAIHAFDAARYVLDADPVAVYCEEWNPGFSWYDGAANATATFEFEGGARYIYTGSWCADGHETSWNGSWRVTGAGGTATWDGESMPNLHRLGESTATTPDAAEATIPREIAGSLAEFVIALRSGETPSGEIHSNVYSLAMVEAAVRSAESGARVRITETLEDARGASRG